MTTKTALIIGGGPAGLTAAYELASRTKIKPVVLEKENYLGGLSATIKYKGYKLDIGGHRFFTKSDRVLDWWFMHMPVEDSQKNQTITYHQKNKKLNNMKNGTGEDVFLIRNRKSRIYYNKKFFDYPLSLNFQTISNLGIFKIIKIGFTYIYAKIFPREENNLEDFFINRFGTELYKTFFKSYTEKVWGKECRQIPATWGAQRVKGLSLYKAVFSFLSKNKETSLIENFLYPKKGPGHFWEVVAKHSQNFGTEIRTNSEIQKIKKIGKLFEVSYSENGVNKKTLVDYVFSTMPIKNLVEIFEPRAEKRITKIANNLEYRDFYVVGILINKKLKGYEDNWIYIHEPNVKVGRIQIFNNWSPYLVKDDRYTWIGMEYFCSNKDDVWKMKDSYLKDIAINELEKLGISSSDNLIDSVVVRAPKAYPSYTGSYNNFETLRRYLDSIENLFLVGRNGMHKYNNQDHSMLTAMVAVDNIIAKRKNKDNIWNVNTEEDYHENK